MKCDHQLWSHLVEATTKSSQGTSKALSENLQSIPVNYYSGWLNTLLYYLTSLSDAIIRRIKRPGNPLAELKTLKNLLKKDALQQLSTCSNPQTQFPNFGSS